MKRTKKRIVTFLIIAIAIAAVFVFIKFFNGNGIYISTGMGKDVLAKVDGQKTYTMDAAVLMSDARSQYEEMFTSSIWSQQIDGKTFEENAIIKAEAIRKMTNCLVLADDSGLEVDYLDKAPGIYSARFMGEDTSYRIKNKAIIDKLAGVPDEKRTARFVCAIAAAFPDGKTITRRGTIEGIIGYEERGENGFGYDPIFFLPEYGKSTAELSPEEKNTISHRGNALRLIKEVINENTDN